MRNYIQPGRTVSIPASADTSGGDVVVIGSLIGVAAGDAVSGADLDIVTEGVFDLPKVEADAIAIGDDVYLDEANKLVTSDDATGTNPIIGVAVSTAANPSASVAVKIG